MIGVEISDDAAIRALHNLNDRQLYKIAHRSIVAGGKIIKQEAVQELRRTIGKSKSRGKGATLRFSGLRRNKKGKVIGLQSLEQRIRLKWHREGMMAKVNVMYPLLHWLDLGTKDRWSKKTRAAVDGKPVYRRPWREHIPTKPGYKGKETPTYFFGKAVDRSTDAALRKSMEVAQINIQAAWMLQNQ